MIPVANRKSKDLIIILLFSVIVLLIMRPWELFFLNDDFEHIPMSGEYFFVRKNFLRPVANLFILLDRTIYNKWSPGYFYTTWFLHTLCVISIYYLCKEVLKKYVLILPPGIALLTSIIFLVYPFHAEPLFWIIGRGAIICTLFTVLSLYYFVRKDDHKTYFILSILALLFALFTYESIWNVALFYFLVTYFNVKKLNKNRKKEYVQLSIIILVFISYLIIRLTLLDSFYGDYSEISHNIYNFPLLVSNLIKLIARHCVPPIDNKLTSIVVFIAMAALLIFTLFKAFKTNKVLGSLMFILVFGVVSAVVTAAPLGISTHTNESERYIYYSSFYFCFFVATATTLIKHKAWKNAVIGVIVASGIFGLVVYQTHYAYASLVTKTTVNFVKKYPDYKKAFFIDVPTEYKGALIYRTCLPNAISWMSPECRYDSVVVVSQVNKATGYLPFVTGEKSWEELSNNKSNLVTKKEYAIIDSNNSKTVLQSTDVVFWYLEAGLFRVIPPQ